MSIPRRRLFIAGGVVVALVAAAVAVWVVRESGDEPGRIGAAMALAPADSQRLSWTDWSGIREEVDSDVSASSSSAQVEDFLLQGFEADLTSTSVLVSSASILHDSFGVSPASVDWELYAQGEQAALLLLGMPESFNFDVLEERLTEIGFTPPDADDGVWIGGGDVNAALGGFTPELNHLSIDRERRIIAGSDLVEGAEQWQEDPRREDRDDGVQHVVEHVEGALSAAVYTGEHACVALGMTQSAPADRARAADLIADAGEVNPMLGFAIAAFPGGDVRVAMAFDSEEQARTNAGTRAKLAAGPAPGQGGTFQDRFDLGRVAAEGTVVTMELEPVPGAYALSDLSAGPVLFATC
jgi:hypothetical protein